ncbi:MAG: ABC transporter ATP-binding protein [bacterium]|jgi:lipopolysaccharide transport system ATP-binding protein|nr:ABC transporter ATP-binding protein [bacterium]
MGNELAIRIEGLGKRYQLGQVIDLSRTFRETLIDLPRFAWQTLRQKMKMGDGPAVEANGDPDTPPGTFWALRDINLEIKHGEVLGIIGRNGAGKSTLLKIISRITTPTTGRIELFGRVGSLLEVGTGFHPELSGRENIYLNGAILGMRKAEIDKKFDEIVAFAETDKFLDTPIKKYSSGMRVRLAFAVAAHLDPEILIVDEVLAVGDAAFQKKCLGKMGEVAKQGRTVLFVSHNISFVESLCMRCAYLSGGKKIFDGATDKSIGLYVSETNSSANMVSNSQLTLQVQLLDLEGKPVESWDNQQTINVKITVKSKTEIIEPAIDVVLFSEHNVKLCAICSDNLTDAMLGLTQDIFEACFQIQNPGLTCTSVQLDIGIRSSKHRAYIGSWQKVCMIPVLHSGIVKYCVSHSIVCFPSIVEFKH